MRLFLSACNFLFEKATPLRCNGVFRIKAASESSSECLCETFMTPELLQNKTSCAYICSESTKRHRRYAKERERNVFWKLVELLLSLAHEILEFSNAGERISQCKKTKQNTQHTTKNSVYICSLAYVAGCSALHGWMEAGSRLFNVLQHKTVDGWWNIQIMR